MGASHPSITGQFCSLGLLATVVCGFELAIAGICTATEECQIESKSQEKVWAVKKQRDLQNFTFYN